MSAHTTLLVVFTRLIMRPHYDKESTMHKLQKLNLITFAATMAALGVVTIKEIIQERHEDNRTREIIEANTAKEIAATHVAQGRIQERIQNGYYDGLPYAVKQIRTDLEFERIKELNRK